MNHKALNIRYIAQFSVRWFVFNGLIIFKLQNRQRLYTRGRSRQF